MTASRVVSRPQLLESGDAKIKQADQISFMKNMALVGALLMLMAIRQP